MENRRVIFSKLNTKNTQIEKPDSSPVPAQKRNSEKGPFKKILKVKAFNHDFIIPPSPLIAESLQPSFLSCNSDRKYIKLTPNHFLNYPEDRLRHLKKFKRLYIDYPALDRHRIFQSKERLVFKENSQSQRKLVWPNDKVLNRDRSAIRVKL